MSEDKKQRVITAVGFLFGMLAAMDALRDASVFWPPDVVWEALSRPHRLELGGGIAAIVATLIVSLVRHGARA